MAATLTSLAVSFTITPSLAGNWALHSKWKPWHIFDRFGGRLRTPAPVPISTRVVEWAALGHRWIVFWHVRQRPSCVAAALARPRRQVRFEFMLPSVDRGEVFVQVRYPTGTPLVDDQHVGAEAGGGDACSAARRASRYRHCRRVATVVPGGSLNVGSTGQLHVFLKLNRKRSTEYWARRFRRTMGPATCRARRQRRCDSGNGQRRRVISEPIDYLVTSLDDRPEAYAGKVLALLTATPGTSHVTSSYQQLSPQVDVIFDRDSARVLDVDIATAANAVRSSYGGSLVAQFETAKGIQYVQVTYPRSAQTNVNDVLAIPIRARNGSLLRVGEDVARLVQDPVRTDRHARTNRQTVIHH